MINVALIGYGYWGKIMEPYIREFFDLGEICTSRDDIDKYIYCNSNIKAVIIATPIGTHYEITKECLKAGKHVFCEKPIAMTFQEADELRDLVIECDLRLAVNYVQTFSPSLQFLVKSTLRDKIGNFEFIDMSTKHLGKFCEYDVYWLLASHHLSILNMFWSLTQMEFEFNDYVYSRALKLYYPEVCTTGSIYCKMPGIIGTDPYGANINVSVNHPEKEMKVVFYGPYGTITYNPLDEKGSLHVVTYKKAYNRIENLETFNKYYQFDEKNNLRYSMIYFRDLLYDYEYDNVAIAILITDIIERRGN